jgi:hypothetical protein
VLLSFAYAQIHNEGYLDCFSVIYRGVINAVNILEDASFCVINFLNILRHALLNFINARFMPSFSNDQFFSFLTIGTFSGAPQLLMRCNFLGYSSLVHYV